MSNWNKIPLKIRFLFAFFKIVVRISKRSDSTINRRLINFFDLQNGPTVTPRKGVSSSDTVVDATRNLWFRIYATVDGGSNSSTTTSLPVIIYFHGGGFCFLSAGSAVYDEFCRRMARELRATVVSINYRLAPEHRYPCQYDDGFDALKFIDENFDLLKFPSGADPKRCFIAGDSAGGNLAHHVTVKSDSRFRRLEIKGLIAIQPFFGGEERTESEIRFGGSSTSLTLESIDWYWKSFLPVGSGRDHPAANVIESETGNEVLGIRFPPTLVVVGGEDPLQDRQRKYSDLLKKNGKEVDLIEFSNMFHGFYTFEEIKESSLFLKEVKNFIEKGNK